MKQKFCINSVASFRDINTSSLNQSKTKQAFSFGRTARFQSIKPPCDKSTYGGDYIKHKSQGTAIGYGTRSDFTKCVTVSPACSKYNLMTEFETNKKKARGSSLALSRDAVVFNQYVPRQARKVPSATHYHNDKPSVHKSPCYSMRKKTTILDRSLTLDPERQNPGPGSYHQPKSTARVSKFSDIAYGTSKSRRFDNSDNGIPGSGSYQNTQPISSFGKYRNSKYKGGTQAKFAKTPRTTFFDQTARNSKSKPGPGFYKQPSEFGQYDGDVYGESALARFSKFK